MTVAELGSKLTLAEALEWAEVFRRESEEIERRRAESKSKKGR